MQRSMYELGETPAGPRITMAVLVGLWVMLAWWLLLGGGLETVHGWVGWIRGPGNKVRGICLATTFSIYYVRILFTEFVFLKRGVGWSETFTVAPWLLFIFLFLGISGGMNPDAWGPAQSAGVFLFLLGSWMNTYAECVRHVWKQQSENRGKLYTKGLFRYSRHPNYLGDLFLFSGMCLISGMWMTAVIPAMMLAGFVFVNIPVLDSHLHDKYGADFDEYAARTRKLIPFLY
jgi:isoprenylcysteine carboxyl methyltransferase (ICMT) family protein YpbQ